MSCNKSNRKQVLEGEVPSIGPPIRPCIEYAGSKFQLRYLVQDWFPRHQIYVEPFGGTGSILLNKFPVGRECWNDMDVQLFSLFSILKNRGPEFIRRLPPFTKDVFRKARKYAGHPRNPLVGGDPMEVALARYVIGSMSFLGKGGTYTHHPKNRSAYYTLVHDLARISQRLAKVELRNVDALQLIPEFDLPGALIYCDPAYEYATRKHYKHSVDPVKLARVLLKIRHAAVAVSEYPNAPYNDLLPSWKRVVVAKKKVVFAYPAQLNDERPRVTESLYCSPLFQALSPRFAL